MIMSKLKYYLLKRITLTVNIYFEFGNRFGDLNRNVFLKEKLGHPMMLNNDLLVMHNLRNAGNVKKWTDEFLENRLRSCVNYLEEPYVQ
ncbi:hypothetical protein RIR_jg3306.t1 [Rhizophagus irregularis DAOM 181602=DAOM 197198]|nr:hypothetical protein RIR_jg3306.t1 [Rhizophagus irregularis DAOM 181602=DAOM 197198]